MLTNPSVSYVGTFNQEKALVGAFSVIVQLRRLIVNSSSLDSLVSPLCGVLVPLQAAVPQLGLGLLQLVAHPHQLALGRLRLGLALGLILQVCIGLRMFYVSFLDDD